MAELVFSITVVQNFRRPREVDWTPAVYWRCLVALKCSELSHGIGDDRSGRVGEQLRIEVCATYTVAVLNGQAAAREREQRVFTRSIGTGRSVVAPRVLLEANKISVWSG